MIRPEDHEYDHNALVRLTIGTKLANDLTDFADRHCDGRNELANDLRQQAANLRAMAEEARAEL